MSRPRKNRAAATSDNPLAPKEYQAMADETEGWYFYDEQSEKYTLRNQNVKPIATRNGQKFVLTRADIDRDWEKQPRGFLDPFWVRVPSSELSPGSASGPQPDPGLASSGTDDDPFAASYGNLTEQLNRNRDQLPKYVVFSQEGDPPNNPPHHGSILDVVVVFLTIIFFIVPWYVFSNLSKQMQATTTPEKYSSVIKTGFWLNILSLGIFFVLLVSFSVKSIQDEQRLFVFNIIILLMTINTFLMLWLMWKLPATVSKTVTGVGASLGITIIVLTAMSLKKVYDGRRRV